MSVLKRCGYCGHDTFVSFLSGVKDRFGFVSGERSFLKCRECGSAWLSPLPDSGELAGFYPAVYGAGGQLPGEGVVCRLMQKMELALWFGPVYRRNARLISRGLSGGARILDVGCGTGFQSLELKKSGFEVTGVDFSPGTDQWMRERHGIKAYVCDAGDIGAALEGREYEVILAQHVVEHMLDPAGFLQGLKRLLAPGGRMFFSMPLVDSFQARLFGKRWGAVCEAPRHVSLPSRKGLSLLFSRAGFTDVSFMPDHLFYIAGAAFSSLAGYFSITASYSTRNPAAALFRRITGGMLAASYFPAAIWEFMGGSYSMGIVIASDRGDVQTAS